MNTWKGNVICAWFAALIGLVNLPAMADEGTFLSSDDIIIEPIFFDLSGRIEPVDPYVINVTEVPAIPAEIQRISPVFIVGPDDAASSTIRLLPEYSTEPPFDLYCYSELNQMWGWLRAGVRMFNDDGIRFIVTGENFKKCFVGYSPYLMQFI
ncbi:hypothetical protein [Vibrio mediterranei]|uniref:hypothetical protein n=1 Tax=Vibrio mediterranei TaxID=689 RepID=UPI004067BD5F